MLVGWRRLAIAAAGGAVADSGLAVNKLALCQRKALGGIRNADGVRQE